MTMIPLTDASRRPARYPAMTTAIILMNVLVFALEIMGGESFVQQWSVIPADIVSGKSWLTVLSAMFMHGGWMHIIGNMVFLHAFGPEVEDAMGRLRYLTFYLLSGIAATLAQILMTPSSHVPNLGASGAIAGVMGAFLITYPRDRIRVLLVIFVFIRTTMIPASLLIGIWFVIQLFSQIGSVADVQSGGVAYAAHVGGFLFGVISARFFERFASTPVLAGD
jgi:membrane associated rhomboid family serine protease